MVRRRVPRAVGRSTLGLGDLAAGGRRPEHDRRRRTLRRAGGQLGGRPSTVEARSASADRREGRHPSLEGSPVRVGRSRVAVRAVGHPDDGRGVASSGEARDAWGCSSPRPATMVGWGASTTGAFLTREGRCVLRDRQRERRARRGPRSPLNAHDSRQGRHQRRDRHTLDARHRRRHVTTRRASSRAAGLDEPRPDARPVSTEAPLHGRLRSTGGSSPQEAPLRGEAPPYGRLRRMGGSSDEDASLNPERSRPPA